MQPKTEKSFMDKLGEDFQKYLEDEEFMLKCSERYLKKAEKLDRARFNSWKGSFFAFIK